jgi:hypothetical protein
MPDITQEYREKYEMSRFRVALALKNLTVGYLERRWDSQLAPIVADPRVSPSFNTAVALLSLSEFEALLPKLTSFTKDAYRAWKYQTLNVLAESDDVAQSTLTQLFKAHPSLETNMAADAALIRKTEQKRTRTLQIALGATAVVAVVVTGLALNARGRAS